MRVGIDWAFAVLRQVAPILRLGRLVLLSRHDDVDEVMSRADAFHVPYADQIRVIMGGENIFLGMNDPAPFHAAKSMMQETIPIIETWTRVRPEVEALSEAVVHSGRGRVDAVMELTQTVTTNFFCGYFGTPARDPVELSSWARELFAFQFVDRGRDPAVRERIEPIAKRLRDHVDDVIAARKAAPGSDADILGRALALQATGAPLDDPTIRNNLIGCIVGGLPQPPMVVPQLLDVLLDRPRELKLAQQAAREDEDRRLERILFEALRFYPLTPGLFRTCARDFIVASGTRRAKKITEGSTVIALTRSAMFDGRRVVEPRRFDLHRPASDYMHFGHGIHECFGVHINRRMIPALCKPLLRQPGLRRADGDTGRLQMEGVFAKSLVLEYGD